MCSWVPYLAILCLSAAGDKALPGGETPAGEVVASPVQHGAWLYGDRVWLKSGRALSGVRIVRQSLFYLEVEVIPGIELLKVPRRQVLSVERGPAAPPPREDPETTEPGDDASDVLAATKTSPGLLRKMAEPFTDTDIVFRDQAIASILRRVADLSGVNITIETPVQVRPVDERSNVVAVRAGSSFDDFLRKNLEPAAPWVVVDFEFDNVRFSARREALQPVAEQSGATHKKDPAKP